MPESAKVQYMTVQDYLIFEETAKLRHEYVRGQVFAMSGSTEAHNIISNNLNVALHNFVRGSGCRVFTHAMKVRVEKADSFYYPDVIVTCEPIDAKSVFKCSPSLIIEVLSPSTRQIDRREKLVAYQQLGSLHQYVIVHQSRMFIEAYTRISQSDNEWQLDTLRRSDELRLQALPHKPLCMPVTAVYDGVDVPTRVEESEEEYELA